jgi:PleD family two-component response regulator
MENPGNMDPVIAEFRKAKMEHFLEQARDFVAVGRLLAARQRLERVFAIDKNEEEARALRREIDAEIAALSIVPGNGTEDDRADARIAKPRRQGLILVVDQDERLLETLTTALRHYGFSVLSATSYEEAVETITLMPPQVIISEINFDSGPRGFDLFLWSRTNAAFAEILFFFLATRIDREAMIAGKRFGVEELISKPVDDEVVVASVASALSRRRPPARFA